MVDIIALVSISFAGIISIIHAVQSSKCDTIDLCCMKCHRIVKNEPENPDEFNAPPVEELLSPRIIQTNLNQ